MIKNSFIDYGSKKITRLILTGSLSVAIVLTLLLITYDIWIENALRARTLIGVSVIAYLLLARLILRKNYAHIVSWMLITLYASLSFSTLLYWGLHSAVGIFATSFIIIMSGFLLGSRSIFPVTIGVVFLLLFVQIIHSSGIIEPDLEALGEKSTFMDVISYASILGVFSLITWISKHQIERTFKRAKNAELSIRAQKELLAIELEKESSRLREIKLKEVQQLYKFAILGQTTAATLHELSNHLAVLNLDIDDLKQQNVNSKAIKNAEEGIEHINKMVRQARRQLNSYEEVQTFNAIPAINRTIKDMQEKFTLGHVGFEKIHEQKLPSFKVSGSPVALMQIISILLNNALDACYNIADPHVSIKIEAVKNELIISVKDNGVGIDSETKQKLFSPTASTKPAGLGVGLYLAHHLIHTQFNGSIELKDSTVGALFEIKIPKYVAH